MSEPTTFWIDLENTPHVPFFIPIIRELQTQGHEVILTARDFGQTKELVERANLDAYFVGSARGSNAVWKAMGILQRAVQLARHVKQIARHSALGSQRLRAVGHGSRGIAI